MRYLGTFLLGAIVAAGAMYVAMQDSGEPVTVSQADPVAVADSGLADDLSAQLARTTEETAQLENELDEANAEIARLTEAAAESEVAEEEAAEEAPAEEDSREADIDEIRKKIAENGMAQAQLKALTEMMYADFINSLDLTAEEKALLRDALGNSFMEQLALNQYAMQSGETPWSEVRAWELEERGYLNDELRGILSADQYRSWEDYAANMEERQLDGALRQQIKSFASGLTPENFDIVMAIAVEEFRAQQIALEQSNALFTMTENVMYQIRAMQAMRERLREYLPADQFAEIENWLTMAENLMMSQLPQDAQ